jgi:hypothetical protein
MSDQEEKRSIVRWLLDVLFGRREATHEEIGGAIHRFGTVRKRLGEL